MPEDLQLEVRADADRHSIEELFSRACEAQKRGLDAEAAADYLTILTENPGVAEAWQNLALILKQAGKLDEALTAAGQAIECGRAQASNWNTRGVVLQRMERMHEALTDYRMAMELDPEYSEASLNLSVGLRELGFLDEAIEVHKRAIARQPSDATHHWNLGFCLMLQGKVDDAWDHLGWRWQMPELRSEAARYTGRLWTGEAIPGETLLLHSEQGLGDTIQFARYVPAAAAVAGCPVILECQPSLIPILRPQPGIQIVARRPAPPKHHRHAPLMCLPRILGMRDPGRMSPASFFRFPNLPKDPETSVVREGPLRVGLVWAGNPLFANDRARSMNLEQLADLLVVAGVEWISLQRGEVAGRLSRTPAGCSITDAGSNLKDFGETAAVLADLDLLISTDTSVPHLAGAMNIPVWLMLSRIPDWRWGVEGTRTSWYPSMTLFRQPVRGDWRSVTSLVRDRLVERVGSLRQR